jgi:hypothetical protein
MSQEWKKVFPVVNARRPLKAEGCLDVDVYNDSTGFCLSPTDRRGAPVPELARHDHRTRAGLTQLLKQGLLLPLELAQDDSFVVRFRLGQPDRQEAVEWTGRVVGRLHLPHGRVMCNGAVVAVPPGEYLAEVCCYLPHSNAHYCLEWAQWMAEDDEPLEDYWARTRLGQDAPDWLDDSGDSEDKYVEFLVRLAVPPKRLRLPALSPDAGWPKYRERTGWRGEDGRWRPVWECRKTARCPLGIRAGAVVDAGL